MAITKSENTFADLTEAEAYFSRRLDSNEWLTASTDRKEDALTTATQLLDDMLWVGFAISESQPLAFPRIGNYLDPKLGLNIDFATGIPIRVVNATCELAYHLLSNEAIAIDSGGVASLQVGPITLTGIKNAELIPYQIRKMIKPLLVNQGVNNWWRSN